MTRFNRTPTILPLMAFMMVLIVALVAIAQQPPALPVDAENHLLRIQLKYQQTQAEIQAMQQRFLADQSTLQQLQVEESKTVHDALVVAKVDPEKFEISYNQADQTFKIVLKAAPKATKTKGK